MSWLPKLTPTRMAVIVLGIALLAVLAREGGRYWCKKDGEANVERLQLIWPQVLTRSYNDKMILLKLSLECGLHKVPTEIAAVQLCLLSAAREPTSSVPNAQQEMKRLLDTP